jgi:autotransporter-associated beta strand protein
MPNKSLARASAPSPLHPRRTPRFLLAGGLAACALVLPQAAFGADRTWDGGGILNFNYNWANNSNWVGGGISPLDSLFFGGTKGLTNNNNTAAGTQYNGITFNAGAGAFILGGNSIKLGGNVTNALYSTATQTINLDMELVGADRTFTATTGDLVVNGKISGSKGMVKAGSGTLALSGDNTYSGGTTLISGRLETSSRLALGGSSNALTIDGGSVYIKGGGVAGTDRLEVGALSGFGTITANNYGWLSTTIAAGTTSTFGGEFRSYYLGGGVINVEKQGEGTLVLNGSSANGGVSSYGNLHVGAGTLEYGRNDSLASQTTINAGATLRAGVSGTLNGYVELWQAGGATFDTQNNNVVLANFRGESGATLVKKGAGLLSISNQLDYFYGGFEVDAGSLTITSDQGNRQVQGGVLVHSGARFAMGGAGALALNGLSANGQVYVNNIGATTVYGALDGSGAIYGNVLSNGVLGGMVPGMLTFGGNVTVVGKHGTSVADLCNIYGNLEYRAETGTYANTPNVMWALSGNSLLSDFTQTRIGGNLIFSSATSLSLAFNGIGSTVNWSDAFWSTDRSWTIWQVAGSTTGLANLTLGLADWKDAGGNLLSALRGGAGFSFGLAANGRDVVLTYSAVPAPGALGLLALAGLAGARRRR